MIHNLDVYKTVYLIRHGQSEGNIGEVFQDNESSLTERGRSQALHLARRMAKLDIELLVASPWQRARETAEAVAKAINKPIEFSDLFVERIRPSSSAGKFRSDPQAKRLEQLWNESLYTSDLRAEDGENYADVVGRADKALHFLEQKNESKIAVVTHGFFLRTIIARLLLGDALQPPAFHSLEQHMGHENAGITVLVYGKRRGILGWTLWIYNDHAHLAE